MIWNALYMKSPFLIYDKVFCSFWEAFLKNEKNDNLMNDLHKSFNWVVLIDICS